MSFERSYCTESHEKIKQILIFGDKSLLLTCWVTYIGPSSIYHTCTGMYQTQCGQNRSLQI